MRPDPPEPRPAGADHQDFADAVLDLVDRVPPGRVVTYGQVAALLGRGGPRGVGGVMARDGAAVPWWRVVRADGTLPAHLVVEAQPHWLSEATPTRRGVVDVERARWWPADG